MSATKRILMVVLAAVAALVFTVGMYLLYVIFGYSRINDHETLTVERIPNAAQTVMPTTQLQIDTEYTALTFNIGFGAYDHAYSFFMDEGMLADGTPTVGTESRGTSKEAVEKNTSTVILQAMAEQPDILLFQEVDVSADRSWDVNQLQAILEAQAPGAYFDYATNFHTGYLFYPPTKPIGTIADAGLLTISNYQISAAERRSLPVSDAFPTKYFDLDRCVSVNRLPVTDATGAAAGELVLINIHPSAYDEGGTIRAQQMEVLREIMTEEYAKHNYVIVGGDFNHAFGGSEEMFLNGMRKPEWVQPFDMAMLPEGFDVVLPSNFTSVATCRDTSIPYQPGVNYEVVIDGFIVSDNIQANALVIDADYLGSDHNPVRLNFTLLKDV